MQILNLTGYGIDVHVDSGRLVIKDGNYPGREIQEKRFRPKTINFDKLVISGNSGSISLSALRWLSKQKKDIVLLDWNGKIITSISPNLANLGTNKLAQYKAHCDPDKKAKIAQWIIKQKIEGSMQVLDWLKSRRPFFRYHKLIPKYAKEIDKVTDHKKVVWIEAVFSQYYWKSLVPVIDKRWEFLMRNSGSATHSRYADDAVNAMLNYGYSILESECWKAVNKVGLEPYIGFIHNTYLNKAPLIYDLQEPFRWIIEKAVLKILQEKKVKRSDFFTTENGNVRLKQSATNVVVKEVGKLLTNKVEYKGKKREWGSMIMIKTRELTHLFGNNSHK